MIESGIFVRGVLVGTKTLTRNFKKDGQDQTTQQFYVGIERKFINNYNQEQTMYFDLLVSKEKQLDSSFMKSLQDNIYKIVELKVNVGDFRNIYIDKNSILTILEDSKIESLNKLAN